jgi:hypothetical protein
MRKRLNTRFLAHWTSGSGEEPEGRCFEKLRPLAAQGRASYLKSRLRQLPALARQAAKPRENPMLQGSHRKSVSEGRLKFHRDLVHPDRTSTDQLDAKLDVISISSYWSLYFVSTPFVRHDRMVSHVIAERR